MLRILLNYSISLSESKSDMAHKRVKKIGGKLTAKSFEQLLKQLHGRGILVVAVINKNCEECRTFYDFALHLEGGLINKLPQLVFLYGFSSKKLETNEKGPPPAAPKEGEENKLKGLSDTNVLDWELIPEGHGYAIYSSKEDVAVYKGVFDHAVFRQNLMDSLRRFKTSIKTLAGLPGKREFMERKASGIIIETSGMTSPEQIAEVETQIKSYGEKIKVPVYFCKGLSQEISYVKAGQVIEKVKGLNFDKIVKKIAKA